MHDAPAGSPALLYFVFQVLISRIAKTPSFNVLLYLCIFRRGNLLTDGSCATSTPRGNPVPALV